MIVSSDMYQSHRLLGCHAAGIHSLPISFLHSLHCLSLLHQAKSLTRIIVLGSLFPKLLSLRQILLRPIV